MINENELKQEFESIKSKRGDSRTDLINSLSLKFMEMVRERKLIQFPREHLNFLVEDLKRDSKQRITNNVLKILLNKGLIKEKKFVTTCVSFENKPLGCIDYGSYSLMMDKNGYKRNLFQYVKRKDCNLPLKKKVKTLKMGESFKDFEFDESEIKSNKPLSSQRVLTNSNLSVLKRIKPFVKVVYEVVPQ